MNELLAKIDVLLNQIAPASGVHGSLEWYLRNHLIEYKNKISTNSTAVGIENATEILMRFCLESMEWGTDLYRSCTALTEQAIRLSKQETIARQQSQNSSPA